MGAYWMCWTHGCRKSVTSNLHGGGQAIAMDRLMKQWIEDDDLRAEINTTAEKFGIDVASFLEDTYGDLCELALDLAIDRSGRIYLLEVNPKPAREVFARIGERDIYYKAITQPLEYALWVYRNRPPGTARKPASPKPVSQKSPRVKRKNKAK